MFRVKRFNFLAPRARLDERFFLRAINLSAQLIKKYSTVKKLV